MSRVHVLLGLCDRVPRFGRQLAAGLPVVYSATCTVYSPPMILVVEHNWLVKGGSIMIYRYLWLILVLIWSWFIAINRKWFLAVSVLRVDSSGLFDEISGEQTSLPCKVVYCGYPKEFVRGVDHIDQVRIPSGVTSHTIVGFSWNSPSVMGDSDYQRLCEPATL